MSDIKLTMTLVDGTLIAALPKLMQASVLKSQTGSGMVKWRLHTHFEVDRYVPSRIDITRSLAANAENVSRFYSLAAAPKTKQPSESNLRAEHYWAWPL